MYPNLYFGLNGFPAKPKLGSGRKLRGMYAPKGTSKAVVDKLNSALRAALKEPEFIKREEALGAVVMTDARLGPAEHKKFVEAEINKWGPAIKAAGQYAD